MNEKWAKFYTEAARERGISEYLIGPLVRYIVYGLNPGSFLSACIRGDAHTAINEGSDNADELKGAFYTDFIPVMIFLHQDVPAGCIGDSAEWYGVFNFN